MSGGLNLAHPSAMVTPARSFAKLVEAEFPTLLSHGFRVVVLRDFGLNGVAVTLAGDRRWLRLTWETRDASVFVSWGNCSDPGGSTMIRIETHAQSASWLPISPSERSR